MAEGWSGGVWLSAHRPYAFSDEHQEFLRPIAALLGSAVEHWRIWDAERRRRERLDLLETLVGALAESLDIREVFARLSAAVQPLLPHDLLVLTELDLRARRQRRDLHRRARRRRVADEPRVALVHCRELADVRQKYRGANDVLEAETGRLEQRSWETQDGDKRSKVEIVADEVGPSLRWATAKVEKIRRDGPSGGGGGGYEPPRNEPATYDDAEEPF